MEFRSVEDDPHTGWPQTAATSENVSNFHVIVMLDQQITAECMGISRERAEFILNDILGQNFLLPCISIFCDEKIACNNADPDNFIEWYVTQDECWVWTRIYAIESCDIFHSKESKGSKISWRSDAICVTGLQRDSVDRLPPV